MAIKRTGFKGKVHIKGRPKEQAKAELMIMKAQERYEDKKRKRTFFTILDIIIIIAFGFAIYSIYKGEYLNAVLYIISGFIPLLYFIIRRILKKKQEMNFKQYNLSLLTGIFAGLIVVVFIKTYEITMKFGIFGFLIPILFLSIFYIFFLIIGKFLLFKE